MKTLWAALALGAIAAAGLAQQGQPAKGKAMFEKACSSCHPSENAASGRHTRDQWQEVIEEMISQQGAKIGEDEVGPILEYLVSAFGKVNVNTAPAGEIAQITGLSAVQAESIVKFRKEKGKFEDFDALAKVPGVDRKKLEESREAIAF